MPLSSIAGRPSSGARPDGRFADVKRPFAASVHRSGNCSGRAARGLPVKRFASVFGSPPSTATSWHRPYVRPTLSRSSVLIPKAGV
jgi:hypothetical protein